MKKRFAIYRATRINRVWYVTRDGRLFIRATDMHEARAWARRLRFTSPEVDIKATGPTAEELCVLADIIFRGARR